MFHHLDSIFFIDCGSIAPGMSISYSRGWCNIIVLNPGKSDFEGFSSPKVSTPVVQGM